MKVAISQSQLTPLGLTVQAILVISVSTLLISPYYFLQCQSSMTSSTITTADSRHQFLDSKARGKHDGEFQFLAETMPDDPWDLWDFKPLSSRKIKRKGGNFGDQQQQDWSLDTTIAAAKKRPLNFVHIPKNGGSSIVQAAIDANLSWGDCLFQEHWPGRSCPSSPAQAWPKEDPMGWGRVWWHLPIQQLPLEELSKNASTSIVSPFKNPYDGFDLFAVVRNPYDRAVSEFYYHCNRFPSLCKGIDGRRAARVMNRNIQKACKALLHVVKTTEAYVFHEGHWIPQHDYFVHEPKGTRKIDHLLHLETLEEEFPSLMKAYGLESKVVIPPHPVKARGDNTSPKMSVLNLTLSTVKLIEVVYENDFILGGYEMMSSKWGQYLFWQQEKEET